MKTNKEFNIWDIQDLHEAKLRKTNYWRGFRAATMLFAFLVALTALAVHIFWKPDYTMRPDQYQHYLDQCAKSAVTQNASQSVQAPIVAIAPTNSPTKPSVYPGNRTQQPTPVLPLGHEFPYLTGNNLLWCQQWQDRNNYFINGHCVTNDYLIGH